MAKFLITGSYTVEGVKGLLKDGGSGRRSAVQKALETLGGRLDSMYFALGSSDIVVICDVPDTLTGVALSLAVNASGGAHVSSTPLVSVEEMDAACRKMVAYRAPGA